MIHSDMPAIRQMHPKWLEGPRLMKTTELL